MTRSAPQHCARTRLAWLAVAGGMMLWAAGCSDAKLELLPPPEAFRDDKLAVEGSFCTVPPESRVFPLRVLFVVDSSESMRVTDPADPVSMETGRERAVRETWERLLDNDPEGIRLGIVRFSAEAQGRTPVDLDGDALTDTYYTADRDLLISGTQSLAATDRTTNYLSALNEARFEMRTELLGAEQQSLPLSKYVVIFVSDGIPDAQTGDERSNQQDNILDAVRELEDLAKQFRVGEFEFHTAYLSAGEGPAQDVGARELLMRMSDVGGGTFRSFPSGESLNFLYVDFTVIRRVFTLKGLSAMNLNTVLDDDQVLALLPQPDAGADANTDGTLANPDGGADAGPDGGADGAVDDGTLDSRYFVDLDGDGIPTCGEPLVDTDTDGLSDYQEEELGTDPLLRDTDDDGLNDRMEWRTEGLDALDGSDARCFIPAPCVDDDGDFYCDCVVDLDLDGICDCQTDPELFCADDMGHDCVDQDMDGFCDCPDLDRDGRCDYPDRDGDGLYDCEEVLFGSSQLGTDSDADGLPDPIEARLEANPTEQDRMLDGDLDQTINGIEVLSNTDLWCDDSAVRSRVAYRYRVDTVGLKEGQTCYDFDIRNITLVPTIPNLEAPYPGNGWNRVLLYVGEVAFDDPNAFASYRVACVMAAYSLDGNLKDPPSGRVRLTGEDFHEAGEFDVNKHCLWP